MSSPKTAGAAKPSLAPDWLYALRYWLRSPKGIAVLVASALVVGAALNWSWLVALEIAPLLLTALPCVAMCAIGLCANKIVGGSCSTETNPVAVPKPDGRAARSLEAVPFLADKSARPDEPIADSAMSVIEPPKLEERT